MENFFVYIDDSGSPGQTPANKFLAPDGKVWAAVILKSKEKKYIERKIKHIKNKIQKKFQFSEFHFTEIYSGKKDFKSVDSNLRLEIFKNFTKLYNEIKPYVVVTSIGKGTLKNSGFSESYINKKENGFNFSNPSDYALYELLQYIDEYFFQNHKDINVEIIIDEGRQRADSVQKLTGFQGGCKELNYKSSAKIYGLQFIDFIVFSINRIQNNVSKERSNFDNEFMKIIGKLQINSNLKKVSVSNLNELNKEFFESSLSNQKTVGSGMAEYIEKISDSVSKMKKSDLKDLVENKEEIIHNMIKIKQHHSNEMSDEFRSILDNILCDL